MFSSTNLARCLEDAGDGSIAQSFSVQYTKSEGRPWSHCKAALSCRRESALGSHARKTDAQS